VIQTILAVQHESYGRKLSRTTERTIVRPAAALAIITNERTRHLFLEPPLSCAALCATTLHFPVRRRGYRASPPPISAAATGACPLPPREPAFDGRGLSCLRRRRFSSYRLHRSRHINLDWSVYNGDHYLLLRSEMEVLVRRDTADSDRLPLWCCRRRDGGFGPPQPPVTPALGNLPPPPSSSSANAAYQGYPPPLAEIGRHLHCPLLMRTCQPNRHPRKVDLIFLHSARHTLCLY
jgi:hypothetical protein